MRIRLSHVSALLLFMIGVSACAPAATPLVMPTLLAQPTQAVQQPAPEQPTAAPLPTNEQPTAAAEPTQAALPFTPAVYKIPSEGIELDYPADWTAEPVAPVGSRGSQGLIFSPGSSADTLAPGGTRMAMTVYEWDPQGDLAAFVAHRKEAWAASGIQVVKEESGNLVDRPYISYVIQTPDNHQAFFLFTTLGPKYLEISGEGDLALMETIAKSVRPMGQ